MPLDNEVLVEVHAVSVNAYDWHFLTADVFLVRLMGGGILSFARANGFARAFLARR